MQTGGNRAAQPKQEASKHTHTCSISAALAPWQEGSGKELILPVVTICGVNFQTERIMPDKPTNQILMGHLSPH